MFPCVCLVSGRWRKNESSIVSAFKEIRTKSFFLEHHEEEEDACYYWLVEEVYCKRVFAKPGENLRGSIFCEVWEGISSFVIFVENIP